jgi:hypothetical protein
MRLPASMSVLLVALVAGAALTAVPGEPARASAPDHTRRTVVRPVTEDGRAATGWTVRREPITADCWGASSAAVDDGIALCGPSAAYLPSCWKSRRRTALCLRDVTSKELVRVRYRGTYPDVTAPEHRTPQGLRLVNGQSCTIRIGGAWGTVPGHPTWVGFFSCTTGDVYGPPDGDGINRRRAVWRVHLVKADGTVVTRRVRRATYVGVAD